LFGDAFVAHSAGFPLGGGPRDHVPFHHYLGRIPHHGTIAFMPNIAIVLKSEISRVARKEVRGETADLKKAVSAYRAEISALKRRTQALEQQIQRLSKASSKAAAGPGKGTEAGPGKALRFSAKGLTSLRKRLGLSAHDCGLLVGASGQSIYAWEDGKARPRAKHLPALAALRTLGKREALVRLEALREVA
jgi:DNA-binding transcriptional regulator YiaG